MAAEAVAAVVASRRREVFMVVVNCMKVVEVVKQAQGRYRCQQQGKKRKRKKKHTHKQPHPSKNDSHNHILWTKGQWDLIEVFSRPWHSRRTSTG